MTREELNDLHARVTESVAALASPPAVLAAAPLACADEDPALECKGGSCDCPCGIVCDCGGCCGCCEALCGHDYHCESVNPTPTREEMFAHFDWMLTAPYRFPQVGGGGL